MSYNNNQNHHKEYNKTDNCTKNGANTNQRSQKPSKQNKTTDGINLDYDYNTEYGDGDIPDIDK